MQRDARGYARIQVRGRCSGFDGLLQVRWAHRPWRAVRAGRGGWFAIDLPVSGPGQASLQVRSTSDPRLIVTRGHVGVGDVYVIAGQSNASGRGPYLSVAEHPVLTACMFGNDDRWKALADPVDSSAGQVDPVSGDGAAGGSVWPRVATELMATEDVPGGLRPLRAWQYVDVSVATDLHRAEGPPPHALPFAGPAGPGRRRPRPRGPVPAG